MTRNDYVHGYTDREGERLRDQAGTLAELLHHDTIYPPGSSVLEAGCGVGAQTQFIAPASPESRFTCVDISETSLAQARALAQRMKLSNVSFQQADLLKLPFADGQFDHVFVCFVLEHLPKVNAALRELQRVLRKGGSITVIEGDHGSAFYHPQSAAAQKAIDCLVRLQADTSGGPGGGDALIGRRLYPLLVDAGFEQVQVSPRFVYADASRPRMVEGFTKLTFNAMVEGVRDAALAAGLIDETTWNQGIADLHRTEQADGTFCYTFFKAVAVKA